jgi:hypothetical protein
MLHRLASDGFKPYKIVTRRDYEGFVASGPFFTLC